MFDFDPKLQQTINRLYTETPSIDWKGWLDISSKEEYESLSIKLSGLSPDYLNEKLQQKTDPRILAVNIKSFLDSNDEDSIVFCHSSGTSGGRIKWFHISECLVKRLWSPGMRAIFESSGLNYKSRVAIFIPSRLQGDGNRAR